MNKQIITSLLDTDSYKFSMGQCIFHHYPEYTTTWNFRCRNKDTFFTQEMVDEITEQIKMYCNLTFKQDELDYLETIPWMKKSYINFLKIWHPRFEDFKIEKTNTGCQMKIEATGTWLNTSMYEIPVLAIVNEVYFKQKYNYTDLLFNFKTETDEKIKKLISGEYELSAFSEFGTRRRLSMEAQRYLIEKMVENRQQFRNAVFVGTSNVLLAKEYGIKPVGTLAHELVQCIGQGTHKHNPAYSNYYTMRAWVNEYQTQNGTFLTDTITTDAFLRDFNLTYATLFSGVRHDSGDPIEWGEKILAHYKKLNIDPTTKTLLFSDSLDFERATKIYNHFKGQAKIAFGIGTYLSGCPIYGEIHPLNIVMKVIECNGSPCAKLSDVEGKVMTVDNDYVDYLRRTISWRLNNTKN